MDQINGTVAPLFCKNGLFFNKCKWKGKWGAMANIYNDFFDQNNGGDFIAKLKLWYLH